MSAELAMLTTGKSPGIQEIGWNDVPRGAESMQRSTGAQLGETCWDAQIDDQVGWNAPLIAKDAADPNGG